MRRFKPVFDAFNAIKEAEGGAPPFTSASNRGDGVLLISATTAWWKSPPAQRQNDLNSLYQMWKVANEQLPVAVVISDAQSRRQLERTDSGAPVIQP